MQRLKLPLWILVGFFWIVLIPFAFVMLYSAIELQNAARAASKADPRLAMLQTIVLVDKLDQAERNNVRAHQLYSRIVLKRNVWLKARSDVRYAAIDLLTAHGTSNASAQCTAPQEIVTKCVSQLDGNACYSDWLAVHKCYDQAVQFANAANASPADRTAVQDMRALMQKARDEIYEYNSLTAQWSEANDLEKDPLSPVAEALRQPLLKTPLRAFFALPNGALIACFTSLMAMLGAGVASLIKIYRRSVARPDALRSFLIAPMIGGLTGFMVFFVVSAGTAVFVQPSPTDSSQPISNLSAPALASLGILAGLAAEQAIAWLQQKASSFFRNQDPPEAHSTRS